MPRPYLVGWWHAFNQLSVWRKRDGWRFMWRRRRMWKQMVGKRYFWLTPEERGRNVAEALESLKRLHSQVSVDAVNKYRHEEYMNDEDW